MSNVLLDQSCSLYGMECSDSVFEVAGPLNKACVSALACYHHRIVETVTAACFL